MGGAIAAEIYLSYHAPLRLNLPFYNVLYPYVIFRPIESYSYETNETFAMSHFRSRAYVYTNEDGFRIPRRTTSCRNRSRRANCASLSWVARGSNWSARSTPRCRGLSRGFCSHDIAAAISK